jgi:hypothetical protein
VKAITYLEKQFDHIGKGSNSVIKCFHYNSMVINLWWCILSNLSRNVLEQGLIFCKKLQRKNKQELNLTWASFVSWLPKYLAWTNTSSTTTFFYLYLFSIIKCYKDTCQLITIMPCSLLYISKPLWMCVELFPSFLYCTLW